jgi:EmrB/QacA subfamily drug resistance transporter
VFVTNKVRRASFRDQPRLKGGPVSTVTIVQADTGGGALVSPARWRWVVLAVVLAADVMDLMDSTIVNIAGPSVRRDLGGGTSMLQWLSAGYTLAFAVLLVAGARLGDIYGRRRLFLIGSAGFTAMSAACAAASSPGMLIAFRVLQGAFGALLIPQGFGVLKETFAEKEMPRVFATFGPVMGLAALAAPILAGLLIDANLWGTGWRLVFLINVPVGLFTLVAAVPVLPRGISHPGMRLDIPGMILVCLALVAIIYPLIQGRTAGWPTWMFGMLAAGLTLLAVFVAYQDRRKQAPLIEPGLLRNRTYTSGIAAALAFFGAFAGLILVLSLFCQLGEHFSPIHAGLTFVSMTIGLVLAMFASFALAPKLGRTLMHIGIAILAAGTAGLALTVSGVHTASSSDLAPSLFVIGLGAGSCFGQLFDFILASVAMDEVGSASGVLNAVQQLASSLGVAAFGTLFFSRLEAGKLATSALATTAWACLIPLALSFALIFLLPTKARDEHPS